MLRDFLKNHLSYKDIGWKEYDEDFIRYKLIKCRWFNLYLHRLDAPKWHPICHDHPWWFVTLLIWPGYQERVKDFNETKTREYRRWPGQILYRPAEFTHSVLTPYGASWSLVMTGPKERDWGNVLCD